MKKGWASFLLFCIASLSVVGYADVAVERPTYSAGDYWILIDEGGKGTKWSFLREEKDKYVFDKEGTEVVKDFSLMDTGKADGFPGPIVKFPLKKGGSWTYEYTMTSGTEGSKAYRARYEAADYDKVTVAAGTFPAFKIAVVIDFLGKQKHTAKEVASGTYWYAPDVKQIIKADMKGKRWELKEYKIK